MAEKRPIPVRLSYDLVSRLDAAATRIGTNRAAIIRFCTETFVKHIEEHGSAAMPPDWKQLLARDDGRKGQGRIPIHYGPPELPGGLVLNDAELQSLAEAAGMTIDELRNLSRASVGELMKRLQLDAPGPRRAGGVKRRRKANA